jgi:catechol 2,3-dioxygenase-like lactoylglutathione lyase family enzyme
MLHAVYRVGNLDDTIEYYKKHFGLKQLRYRDIPEVPGPGAGRSALAGGAGECPAQPGRALRCRRSTPTPSWAPATSAQTLRWS